MKAPSRITEKDFNHRQPVGDNDRAASTSLACEADEAAAGGIGGLLREWTEQSPATTSLATLAVGIGIGALLVHFAGPKGTRAVDSLWQRFGKSIVDSVADALPSALSRTLRS